MKAARKVSGILARLVRRSAFAMMERLLPVRKDYWCFCAWPGAYPHTVDNPRAVFKEIKDDASIVKIVLSRAGEAQRSLMTTEGRNVRVVAAESLRGAYHLAISRVVLVGFALPAMSSYADLLTTKHHIIQLWHGVPLK